MQDRGFSRRHFLLALSGFTGSALALEWSEVEAAAHHAMRAASAPGTGSPKFLTPAEAADVEAVSSQIVPSDDTPGAREAGVVLFIDQALATFFSPIAGEFRGQLAEFRVRCHALHSGQAFAALTSERQIEFLRTVESTPFFARMKLLTVLGLFALPAYGGNRNHVGWQLIGFEDQHVFEPPFGYYDRDYPGFDAKPEEPA